MNNRDKGNNYLPEEILLHIFSFLNSKELTKVQQVSKYWNRLGQDMSLPGNLAPYYLFIEHAFETKDTFDDCRLYTLDDLIVCVNQRLKNFYIPSFTNYSDVEFFIKTHNNQQRQDMIIVTCEIPEKYVSKPGNSYYNTTTEEFQLDLFNTKSIRVLAPYHEKEIINPFFKIKLIGQILTQIKYLEEIGKKEKILPFLDKFHIFVSASKQAWILQKSFYMAIKYFAEHITEYNDHDFLNYTYQNNKSVHEILQLKRTPGSNPIEVEHPNKAKTNRTYK